MTSPEPRQPIFNIPASVIGIIAAMAGIQAVREAVPDQLDADLLARFAFVPGRFLYRVDPAAVLAAWAQGGSASGESAEIARFFLGDGSFQPWTSLTYALLHGGWTHLGLNGVWLLAFGSPLARRVGAVRFLLFMAFGALAGAAAHFAVSPTSLQPLVGASASVSACMAASLRFMFRGRAGRLFEGADPLVPDPASRVSLLGVFADRRSLAFVVVWFLTNIVTGIGAVPFGMADASVAWQAHIGGFVAGLLAFPLFDRRPPAVPPSDPEPDGRPAGP